jgi:hypothetical protein
MPVANVWLKGYFEGDTKYTLFLTCRVDTLTSGVAFVGPNEQTFGGCYAPIHQRNDSECLNDTSQDLTTNTTTLFLKETNTSMSGVWRCTHGTNTGEDWLNITIPPFCKAYWKPEGRYDVLWVSEYYFPLHSIASLIMSQKHDKSFLLSIEQAIFEKTKGVIRCGILKKDRQCNDQKKRGKRTNNDLQNTSQNTKDRATQTRLKTGGAQVLYLLH